MYVTDGLINYKCAADGEAGDQATAAVVSPGAVVAAAGGAGGPEGDPVVAEDPLLAFPPGGYWALPAGARLRMLRSLCFDALETRTIRQAPNLNQSC